MADVETGSGVEGETDALTDQPTATENGNGNTAATATDPVQDAATDPVQDAATDPVQDAATDPVQDAAIDPVQDAATDPVQDAATEALRATAFERALPSREASLTIAEPLNGEPAAADDAPADITLVLGLLIVLLLGAFFAHALRRQRRRRREEIGRADEAEHPETEAPHPPATWTGEPSADGPVPPVVEGPPASPGALLGERELERAESEKERRRREFLARQQAAREGRDREEAEKLATERAAEEEAARLAEEEREQREAEEAARREALLASSGPLTDRLAKTRGGFVGRLNSLLGKRIDENTLEQIEEVLFTADIGVHTAGELLETVRDSLKKTDLADPERVRQALKSRIAASLANGAAPGAEALDPRATKKRPFVIMVIGVNGVGKTTTIGKLAGRYVAQGMKVVLAAGDTFRAAAVEQLEVWADRVGCTVVKGKDGADPGSVTFDAVQKGILEDADVVIVDTAGRLHTKVPLMEELSKVHRVLGKARDGAPDEVLLVVDATTGQNALQQARMFREAVPVSGIALTKLDGTAKGGVIIGITGELHLPVRYIGVGEKVGDLRPFDAAEFVEALFA